MKTAEKLQLYPYRYEWLISNKDNEKTGKGSKTRLWLEISPALEPGTRPPPERDRVRNLYLYLDGEFGIFTVRGRRVAERS